MSNVQIVSLTEGSSVKLISPVLVGMGMGSTVLVGMGSTGLVGMGMGATVLVGMGMGKLGMLNSKIS